MTGLLIATATALLSVYGGIASVEILLDRYATPESRHLAETLAADRGNGLGGSSAETNDSPAAD